MQNKNNVVGEPVAMAKRNKKMCANSTLAVPAFVTSSNKDILWRTEAVLSIDLLIYPWRFFHKSTTSNQIKEPTNQSSACWSLILQQPLAVERMRLMLLSNTLVPV